MILKMGISGYECDGEFAPLIDFDEFKAICSYTSSRLKTKLLSINKAYSGSNPYANYHTAWLRHPSKEGWIIAVFLNAHYRFLAIAEIDSPMGNASLPEYWLDAWKSTQSRHLIKFFAESYQILSDFELQTPIELLYDSRTKKVELTCPNELCQSELLSLRQWHPKRLHHILFNTMD